MKTVGEGNSVAVQKRRKRVSKRNKIAWRKHTNIKDVETFLDDLRLEERVGGHLSTREDDKLFYFDTALNIPRAEKSPTNADRKLEAKRRLQGVPKCFESLVNKCPVPDPIKRNRVLTVEERIPAIRKRIETDRKARGILKAKEKMAIKNRETHEEWKSEIHKSEQYDKDLWNNDGDGCDVKWLSPTAAHRILLHTQKIRKKVPITITQKTSALPAIEMPHPGISYNPSYADHRTLLENIVNQEKKRMKEEEHITRVTTQMFSKVTQEEKDDDVLKELLQGLPKSDEKIIKEEEDEEYKAVNPPAKDKKKTRKTRRNIEIGKQEKEQRKVIGIEKKKVADIYKLKKIVQDLNQNDVKELRNQALRKKKKELKEFQAKRLSNLKYEEPDPDFNMPEHIQGNLRDVRTEGCILKDRFKSLQKRNILQPTVRRVSKKIQKKMYTKNSHK